MNAARRSCAAEQWRMKALRVSSSHCMSHVRAQGRAEVESEPRANRGVAFMQIAARHSCEELDTRTRSGSAYWRHEARARWAIPYAAGGAWILERAK
jgi:hypothetical protein